MRVTGSDILQAPALWFVMTVGPSPILWEWGGTTFSLRLLTFSYIFPPRGAISPLWSPFRLSNLLSSYFILWLIHKSKKEIYHKTVITNIEKTIRINTHHWRLMKGTGTQLHSIRNAKHEKTLKLHSNTYVSMVTNGNYRKSELINENTRNTNSAKFKDKHFKLTEV